MNLILIFGSIATSEFIITAIGLIFMVGYLILLLLKKKKPWAKSLFYNVEYPFILVQTLIFFKVVVEITDPTIGYAYSYMLVTFQFMFLQIRSHSIGQLFLLFFLSNVGKGLVFDTAGAIATSVLLDILAFVWVYSFSWHYADKYKSSKMHSKELESFQRLLKDGALHDMFAIYNGTLDDVLYASPAMTDEFSWTFMTSNPVMFLSDFRI